MGESSQKRIRRVLPGWVAPWLTGSTDRSIGDRREKTKENQPGLAGAGFFSGRAGRGRRCWRSFRRGSRSTVGEEMGPGPAGHGGAARGDRGAQVLRRRPGTRGRRWRGRTAWRAYREGNRRGKLIAVVRLHPCACEVQGAGLRIRFPAVWAARRSADRSLSLWPMLIRRLSITNPASTKRHA